MLVLSMAVLRGWMGGHTLLAPAAEHVSLLVHVHVQ